MSRKENAYLFLGLIVAIFSCIAAYLALPQVQERLGNVEHTSPPEPMTQQPPSTDTVHPSLSLTQDIPTASSTSVPPTVISSATPTREQPDVLYKADWSNGLNDWTGSPDWKTASGMLVNDGSAEFPASGIIFAPYQLDNIPDYAVESEIQVIGGQGGGCAAHFGFILRGQEQQGNLAGYLVGGINTLCTGQGYLAIAIWASPTEPWNVQVLDSASTVDDKEWHKYRAEVRGNTIRLLLDGIPIMEATDNTYLNGNFVALWSGKAVVNIRDFRIIKL